MNTFGGSADVSQATADFTAAMQMTDAGPASNWWVMHTPAVQAIYYGGQVNTGGPGVRQALQDATGLQFCGTAAAPVPCRPSQFLLGHEHLFQSLTFPARLNQAAGAGWMFPRQVIVGHGGTRIDNASPAPQGDGACTYTSRTSACPAHPPT